jgi:hypothetical protein
MVRSFNLDSPAGRLLLAYSSLESPKWLIHSRDALCESDSPEFMSMSGGTSGTLGRIAGAEK